MARICQAEVDHGAAVLAIVARCAVKAFVVVGIALVHTDTRATRPEERALVDADFAFGAGEARLAHAFVAGERLDAVQRVERVAAFAGKRAEVVRDLAVLAREFGSGANT